LGFLVGQKRMIRILLDDGDLGRGFFGGSKLTVLVSKGCEMLTPALH
jgi:hypothetical protein